MPPPRDQTTASLLPSAEELGVTAGTVRRYINDRILPSQDGSTVADETKRAYGHGWVENAKKTLRGDAND